MPLSLGAHKAPEIIKKVYTSVSRKSDASASGLASLAPRLGWRFGATRRGTIEHWDVPPPFGDRRQALMELGPAAYAEACKEYYEEIGKFSLERAKRTHARWVVRRCLREFETQMRKFQRHWERRGHDFNPADNRGQLFTPEELYESSRMLVDIPLVLRRWQVAPELREATERVLRARLRTLWELKP